MQAGKTLSCDAAALVNPSTPKVVPLGPGSRCASRASTRRARVATQAAGGASRGGPAPGPPRRPRPRRHARAASSTAGGLAGSQVSRMYAARATSRYIFRSSEQRVPGVLCASRQPQQQAAGGQHRGGHGRALGRARRGGAVGKERGGVGARHVSGEGGRCQRGAQHYCSNPCVEGTWVWQHELCRGRQPAPTTPQERSAGLRKRRRARRPRARRLTAAAHRSAPRCLSTNRSVVPSPMLPNAMTYCKQVAKVQVSGWIRR